jgi:enoyl-CoA hydratase/carnithine racemase
VHGHCIAAGCYLELVYDITVAAEEEQYGGRPKQQQTGGSNGF